MGKTKEVDLADMSDEQLMDEWTALAGQVQSDRERLVAFSHEHQRRNRKAQLAAVASDMTDEDLALLQEAMAEGVESEEDVHNG